MALHCFFFLCLLVSLISLGASNHFSIVHKSTTVSKSIETILQMASTDTDRINYLSSLTAIPQRQGYAPISYGSDNYIVRASFGTPPQPLEMVLDISTDVVWIPLRGAYAYKPKLSSTYSILNCSSPQCAQARGFTCTPTNHFCSFNESYGGDSSFFGTLTQDTLTLPSGSSIPNFAFGSINAITGPSIPPLGIMGLGRGSISLITQTTSYFSGVFSYCLPSHNSPFFSGMLILGRESQPKSLYKYTPLLMNPQRPSLYYVNLTGVSVGYVRVPIDPMYLKFDEVSGSGTIIDSGTVITRFVKPVYEAIRDEYRKQVSGPILTMGLFDTCFSIFNETKAPEITFHMTSLDLKLSMENTLLHFNSGTLACLPMAMSPQNVNAHSNIIANLQQQNTRILYDVPNSRIGFSPENCN